MNKNKKFNKFNIIDKVFIIISILIIILGISEIIEVYSEPIDNITNEIVEDIKVESKSEDIENYEEKISIDDNKEEVKGNLFFNKILKGRGRSDEGRNEPQYVGLYGYLSEDRGGVVDESTFNTPWIIPVYGKIDYDNYQIVGSLEHKTIVKVKSQDLAHQGYGRYDGYLTVEVHGQEGTEYLIDVRSFITNDYWHFEPITKAASYGTLIAEYNQVSDKLPVHVNNDILYIENGTKVIVVGETGSYSSNKVKKDLRQIEARYYNTYGELSRIFFNEEDLKIIY